MNWRGWHRELSCDEKNYIEHVIRVPATIARWSGVGDGVDENDEFEMYELAFYKLYTSFASNMLYSDGIGSADAYISSIIKKR